MKKYKKLFRPNLSIKEGILSITVIVFISCFIIFAIGSVIIMIAKSNSSTVEIISYIMLFVGLTYYISSAETNKYKIDKLKKRLDEYEKLQRL